MFHAGPSRAFSFAFVRRNVAAPGSRRYHDPISRRMVQLIVQKSSPCRASYPSLRPYFVFCGFVISRLTYVQQLKGLEAYSTQSDGPARQAFKDSCFLL